MAVYSLLFGHVEWPEDPPRRDLLPLAQPVERERSPRSAPRAPSSFERRPEESVDAAGLAREAFVDRVVARSVPPRLGA